VTTAEPAEVVTTVFGVFALAASLYLLVGSIMTARAAERMGKCDAVRSLAWGRVENELMRGVVVLVVLLAGIGQLVTPMPEAGSSLRAFYQWSWAVIAILNLVMSLRNERRVHRVVTIIERERAAGRMQSE